MTLSNVSDGWRLQNRQRRQLATQETSAVQVDWELIQAHLNAQDWSTVVPRLETMIASASRLLSTVNRLTALDEIKPLIEAPDDTADRLANNAAREHGAS